MGAAAAVGAVAVQPESGSRSDDGSRRLALPSRLALWLQDLVARLAGPVTVSAIGLAMRWWYRWSFHQHRAIRRRFAAELAAHRGPVLVAANHLTFVDSPILTWGLASVARLVLCPTTMPWNVPERSNFAASLPTRVMAFLYKCLPITRGGDRHEITLVLTKLAWLMRRGHLVLMFPEARRSRTGRIDRTHAAHGVGRLVKEVPGTRVLCVYLRGDHQAEYSFLPVKGERFHLATSWLEPVTTKAGLRGSVDLTDQILTRLEELERAYFDGRQ